MYWGFKKYVPVARRRAKAANFAKQLAKKQRRSLCPVKIDGRKIANTFWGEAWCDNLESYSDFANRLPRGRTYVRNGSVIDLQIKSGVVEALVSGSDVYTVNITISRLKPATWETIKKDCAAEIDSLLDLLSGRLSEGVMQRLTRQQDGLFPQPSEIGIKCSCPDWAGLCKHAAAVMYGVGSHLDGQPELLFRLRDVDHAELVSQAVSEANLDQALGAQNQALEGQDLGALFGIEMDSPANDQPTAAKPPRKRSAKNTGGRSRATTPANTKPKHSITTSKSRHSKNSKAGIGVTERKTAKPAAAATEQDVSAQPSNGRRKSKARKSAAAVASPKQKSAVPKKVSRTR